MLLLFLGIFPLVYSLVVSFQNITMLEEDTSFSGLLHYGALFRDLRLWQALGHTLLITAVALPLELILGLLMALCVWNLLYAGAFYGWLLVTDHWTWLHSVLIVATFSGGACTEPSRIAFSAL